MYLSASAYKYKHWVKIAQYIPGRTDIKCRERWSNILSPKVFLKKEPWTTDEEEYLKTLVREYGYGKWSEISKKMAEKNYIRTDAQVKDKTSVILPMLSVVVPSKVSV